MVLHMHSLLRHHNAIKVTNDKNNKETWQLHVQIVSVFDRKLLLHCTCTAGALLFWPLSMKDILDLLTLATTLSSSKVNDRWNHSPVGQEKSLSPSETPEPLSNEVAVSADQHSKDSPPVRINKTHVLRMKRPLTLTVISIATTSWTQVQNVLHVISLLQKCEEIQYTNHDQAKNTTAKKKKGSH